jgi:transcriptional regulator with XRE-family HTH domain
MNERNDILFSNIKWLLQKQRVHQKDLANQIGVTRQHLNAVLAGRYNYSDELIDSIANALGVKKSDLFSADMQAREPGIGYGGESQMIRIPFLEIKKDGHPKYIKSRIEAPIGFTAGWLYQQGDPDEMAIVRSKGESLDGRIPDNALVLVDMSQTRIRSGRPYLLELDNEVVIRRITLDGGTLTAHSDRKGEKDLTWLDAEGWEILGRCLWYCESLD